MNTRYMTLLMMASLMIAFIVGCGSTPTDATTVNNKTTNNQPELPEQEEQDQTRQIVHDFGTSDIPAKPERIVSVNLEDMLLSLDIPLVLATPNRRQDYLDAEMEKRGIKYERMSEELNFEVIIAADPDLIIVSSLLGEETYKKLNAIAPTIAYNRSNWRDSILQIGEALDVKEQAEQVRVAHEEKIAAVKQEISQLIGEQPTVAFLRMQEKDLRLFLPSILSNENPMSSYVGIAYEGLGWQADPFTLELQKENPDRQNATISLEVLPQLTAEHLFVITLSSDGSDENLQKTLDDLLLLEDSAVWNSIPPVKQGHVYILNMKNWLIEGPKAEQAKLDELINVLKSK